MFLEFILIVALAATIYYTYYLAPPAHLCYGEHRRRAFQNAPKQQMPDGITHSAAYITSADGDLLHTQSWIPTTQQPKANIFMLHGYADWTDFRIKDYALQFAQRGYAVFGIDHYGHGRSDGLHVDIRDWHRLIQDAADWIRAVQSTKNGKIKSFAWGESMGGAIALELSLQHSGLLDGLVLFAPMVRIADDMKPKHPIITQIGIKLANIIPTVAVAPVPDVVYLCFKDPQVTADAIANPYRFSARPRLATAVTMLTTTLSLNTKLHTISIPFIVMHGDADRVTEAKSSQELFRLAASKDKTIKLYPGRWHSILCGEPLENQKEVYQDMFSWLDERA